MNTTPSTATSEGELLPDRDTLLVKCNMLLNDLEIYRTPDSSDFESDAYAVASALKKVIENWNTRIEQQGERSEREPRFKLLDANAPGRVLDTVINKEWLMYGAQNFVETYNKEQPPTRIEQQQVPVEPTQVSDWISVNDRLPPIGEEVQVYIPSKNRITALALFIRYEGVVPKVGNKNEVSWWWDNVYPGSGNMHLANSVSHWAPLMAAPAPAQQVVNNGRDAGQ